MPDFNYNLTLLLKKYVKNRISVKGILYKRENLTFYDFIEWYTTDKLIDYKKTKDKYEN